MTEHSPTLAGGMTVVKTFDEKAMVTSVIPVERTLALRSNAGKTITCKAAPQITNFGQLQVGTRVKATITDAVAIFPTKNGPPPSAGPGVAVGGESVVLQTQDYSGKATRVDRSYRLLTVQDANGGTKQFKVPLPDTLKNVLVGDEVVVRTVQPLLIRAEPM